jgi:hypothetical protein
MLDPNTYILLHKYQQSERIKQAEHEHLLQAISYPSLQVLCMMELSKMYSNWRTRRSQKAEENRLVEGKVVMP